jgi:hypothetical protein
VAAACEEAFGVGEQVVVPEVRDAIAVVFNEVGVAYPLREGRR